MNFNNASNGTVPGVSIRMGPVEEMDVDEPATNGAANGKRKSRSSINGKSYKDASSSEDDIPLVRYPRNALRMIPAD